MAKVTYRKTQGSGVLKPGEEKWVQLGESDEFRDGAIAVTAIPHHGTAGTQHVLRVDNINITMTETHQGDITLTSYNAGCSVKNNGKTTIDNWEVVVGVINA